MIKVRIKLDAKCKNHAKYNPVKDGKPRPDCEGCDRIYVMWLYSKIVARAASSDKVSARGSAVLEKEDEKENVNTRESNAGAAEENREPEKPSDAA